MWTVTWPLPVPLAALLMVIHGTSLDAVHAQLWLEAVTSTDLSAFGAPMESALSDSVIEHVGGGAAAWVTVNVRPPTVNVPVRGVVSLLAATENCTVPLPVPEAPAVIDSHGTSTVAAHAQLWLEAVTSTELSTVCAPMERALTDSVIEHVGGGAAAWVTVNVRPPTVNVPVRGVVSLLAATENCTVPLPVPEAPAVIDSHGTLAVAAHAQPVPVNRFTDPVVLDALTDCELADREYVHGVDDTPDCVTIKVWPAIVAVPVRAAEDPFAAAVIPTIPSPAPLAPAVIVSQEALVVAVHSQPSPASTVSEMGPPAAATDCVVEDSENVHAGAGAPAAACESL